VNRVVVPIESSRDSDFLARELLGFLLIVKLVDGLVFWAKKNVFAAQFHADESAIAGSLSLLQHQGMATEFGAIAVANLASERTVSLSSYTGRQNHERNEQAREPI
jgi:hypothetical protein